jgi:NAD(P)-dependent dehydrogenase (short-subunit alcohol dehydrogenase family)
MTSIVITGSTRGIGFALADRFLVLDCAVAVSGRARDVVARAVDDLAARHGGDRVWGVACDVRDRAAVQGLWDEARNRFGRVDIWINNAGLSNRQAAPWEVTDAEMAAVVDTNLMGVIHGSNVAARGMLAQGKGAIYNFEGLGSDGRMIGGLLPYGTTKAAVRYFTRGLTRELAGTSVIVGAIQPGMVITDMITTQYEGRPEDLARARRIFNIIADRPDAVAARLAPRILANRRSGVHISYNTWWTIPWRFATAPLTRRDLFGTGVGRAEVNDDLSG